MLKFFLGDEQKAAYYADLPPIVVFFGWAAFLFTPWLVLFTVGRDHRHRGVVPVHPLQPCCAPPGWPMRWARRADSCWC